MKTAKNAAITILGLIVLLVCLEASLRVLNIRFGTVQVQTDPVLGFSLRPNSVGWETNETVNPFSINSDGMRDVEHAVKHPPGTLRIAVLGDSTTEAFTVPFEKSYTSVFQREVNQCLRPTGTRVETLNFATIAYNLAQQVYLLPQKVWKYQPDIVVVALSMGTIVTFESHRLDWQELAPRMHFVYRDGKLVSDEPHGFPSPGWKGKLAGIIESTELGKLANHSKWKALHNLALFKADLLKRLSPQAVSAKETGLRAAAALEDVPYLPPRDQEMQNAWMVTEGLLDLLNRECRAHGAVLHLVTLDTPEQTMPAEYRVKYQRRLGVPDLDYSDRRISNWCSSHGVTCFQIAPALRAVVDEKHILLHGASAGQEGKGHLNEAGHYYTGMALARQYCDFFRETGAANILRASATASQF